jgi:hypothetical protein
MATRQPKGDNVGFYLRIPADVKTQLEAKAAELKCSRAQLIVDLVKQGLGMTAAAAQDQDVEISEWLANVDG